MSIFNDIRKEIENGIAGKNSGLSMGFNRLEKFVSIRRRIYTVIFAGTGMGKSAFLHNAYILNPYDWSQSRHNSDKIKFHVILFSMERSSRYTVTKWLSRKIFLEKGIYIPVAKILGWWTKDRLNVKERDLLYSYGDYFDQMLDEHVTIIEGPQTAKSIEKVIDDYAAKHGTKEQVGENNIYTPNNETLTTLVCVDHMSLMGGDNKKKAIDDTSKVMQKARDLYGFSPTVVMQLNRDIANPLTLKTGTAEPTLEMAKDSGTPLDDADLVISLFNPQRYKQDDASGYKMDQFLDPSTGAFYFRSLKILKSTYGEDDIRIGMAFHGPTGTFTELPKVSDMDFFDYENLFNGKYFLK